MPLDPDCASQLALGEVVWPHGKVTVGKVVSDNASVLARKRRLNELTDDVWTPSRLRVGEAELPCQLPRRRSTQHSRTRSSSARSSRR